MKIVRKYENIKYMMKMKPLQESNKDFDPSCCDDMQVFRILFFVFCGDDMEVSELKILYF